MNEKVVITARNKENTIIGEVLYKNGERVKVEYDGVYAKTEIDFIEIVTDSVSVWANKYFGNIPYPRQTGVAYYFGEMAKFIWYNLSSEW